ncbi:sulfurtransferase complex subunit TusD [Cellvibrio japonicus]|uniref:DsrE protein n=1 Tax=Cellvibrio japonicus (strain Ueda107) TaxID=498211 RepID=B3PEU0_CELJU|nr:sulfurtransferase complex subunit TusD [Cellvibrio japonicus]ACE83703.1 dsrE protein [Cellvibrio japonicus Ueda107]QEI12189.1 sulfurtransferase complex subunit TusD [Cellvibrio japonicus]QEI15763.1 sulfurtransferase complex subunit TusD [Cellvibrio japonicus]QEI19341.1 sulfurtransferase complex subunit TusD [Cellvibrio japonicus]
MARFSIAVYAPPQTNQTSFSAWQFAQSVLAQGHELYRVFFYMDGVHNADSVITPPQGEPNLVTQWQTLAQNHGTDLVVCIAAALRRGVLNEEEAKRYRKHNHNLAEGFSLSGLGQLVEAIALSDRLIVFGN